MSLWPWWQYLLAAVTTHLFFRLGVVLDRELNPVEPVSDLNPYLTAKELPFDRDLAAIGVLEPEFTSVVDEDKYDQWRRESLAKAEILKVDYEQIHELGRDGPVAIMAKVNEPVKATWHESPPTKQELRWRNTLVDAK